MIVALALAAVSSASCMRVEVSFRDVGQPDAWAPDAARPARPDAAIDAPGMDAPRIDANDIDAPTFDTATDVYIPTGADGTRAVLASIGEHVILAGLRELVDAADRLVAATDAARTLDTPESLAAAQDAWRDAMRIWQHLEAVQIGPAGLALYTAGGRDLRDTIHSWPFISYCRIDQDTVEGLYGDVTMLRSEPVSVRGMAALEYLLFESTGANRCPATNTINTDGSWAALGAEEIGHRRVDYAHSAAVIVAEQARVLENAWDPAGENFLGTLATAGSGSTLYPSAQQGLNAMSDALFYIYKEVTDIKIGIPSGIYVDCVTATCPDNVEAPFADASLDHVRANLEGFRDAYLGAPPPMDAPGFDDLLRSMGASDLDTRIQEAIVVALAAIDLVDGALEVAVDTDADDVLALHEAIRTVADLFKVEVLTLLDLELPARLEGDND